MNDDLIKIDDFYVGRAFSLKMGDNPIKYGWVVGYALNSSGELVFRAQMAHRQGEQLVHPANVFPVTKDWNK